MDREVISNGQGISILSIFLMGSSLILGTGKGADQDVWIAIPLAVLMAVPMLLIYSKLLTMFPGKNLYDILQDTFGEILGKLICLLFVWYTFHLGSIVLRVLGEFVNVVTFPETPELFILIPFSLLCIWVIRAGIEVLGRFCMFILPLLLTVAIFLYLLSTRNMEFINMKPVLYNGIKPVLAAAFDVFSFPLTQIAVFTMVFHSVRNEDKVLKMFFISILIGVGVLYVSSIKNILVLGVETNKDLYFPTYTADRVIKLGQFLERIEVIAAFTFVICAFVKVSICLYAASIGVAKILGIEDYKKIVAPIGLLMMNLASILYSNTMEMFYWAENIYKYYAVPFQVILPVIILIGAALKNRSIRNTK